jgi:anaerobic ribonucleoside-triphosphate reductase activating protein
MDRGETTVADVLEAITPWISVADGVTISGGEPFQQPEALEMLLHGLRQLSTSKIDVLVYSGYPWEQIAAIVGRLDGFIDVLISDPFDAKAGQTLLWRGSDNQRMHLLTPLAEDRYRTLVDAPRSTLPAALDVFFEDGVVWMAGIPLPGTMEVLRNQLAEAGFSSTTSEARSASFLQIFS